MRQCLRWPHRQPLHLGGNNGKAASCFTRPCCFDRGVERQEVGSPGNVPDQLDDVADLLGSNRERLDLTIGRFRFFHRRMDHSVRELQLAADLGNGGDQFVDRDRGRLALPRG